MTSWTGGVVPGWVLVLTVTVAWYATVVEAASRCAVENLRNPLPNGQRRATSVFPALPVMPILFIGAGLAIDTAFETEWGSLIIGSAHVLIAVACGYSVWVNQRQLKGESEAE